MATNRLKSRGPDPLFKSKTSALEFAQIARGKGLMKHAEAWEQAARDGWDDKHYDPSA